MVSRESEAWVIKFLLTLTTSPFFNNGLLGDIPAFKSILNFLWEAVPSLLTLYKSTCAFEDLLFIGPPASKIDCNKGVFVSIKNLPGFTTSPITLIWIWFGDKLFKVIVSILFEGSTSDFVNLIISPSKRKGLLSIAPSKIRLIKLIFVDLY